MMFYTVPWAPGLERAQLERCPSYVALRSTAIVWQLGIRKGFARETVKARLASELARGTVRGIAARGIALALELGMIEAECDYLAEELPV